MGRGHIEAKLVNKTREPRGLAFREVEHETRKRGGVDDRMLERALQPAPHEPGVERVVAVLDQDRALRETQEGAPRVFELRRADEHRAVDVVALASVGVDRRPAVDQGVEEGERAVEREALGPDLEDEERRVASRLDIERDELRLREAGQRPQLRRVDGNLLPRHKLCRPARLQVGRSRAHRASASARLAQAISSPLTALRSSTAAA